MDILWHGHSCFTVKGKRGTAIIDPLANTGFKPERLKADLVLVTDLAAGEDLGKSLLPVSGEPKIFALPGEYEVSEIPVMGVQAWDKSKGMEEKDSAAGKKDAAAKKIVMYQFMVDGIKVCHLGSLGHSLTSEMIERIGDTDVLIVPVGGKDCLDAKKAHEIIEAVEPRVVIPMLYKVGDEKGAYDGVENFLKISGISGAACEPKEMFSVATRAQLPQDKTEYVVLAVK